MLLIFENQRLKGRLLFTDTLHSEKGILADKSYYKFIRVVEGNILVEVDELPVSIQEGEIICLTPLHHLSFIELSGRYTSLLFNSNFYCIHGNDHEVSCNGLLFHGSSHIGRIDLTPEKTAELDVLSGILKKEFVVYDALQEEMLRVLLKRYIIVCTRVAQKRYGIIQRNGHKFETIRKFMVLVDMHFKEKKQVQEYADLLYKSPKTLSNLLLEYNMPSAIRIIHERIEAEAKRLLLYSSRSFKDIADILGFEDQATFARFFKKMTGLTASEFRKQYHQ